MVRMTGVTYTRAYPPPEPCVAARRGLACCPWCRGRARLARLAALPLSV